MTLEKNNKIQMDLIKTMCDSEESQKEWAQEYGSFFRSFSDSWDSFQEQKKREFNSTTIETIEVEDKRPLFSLLWLEGRSLMKNGRKIKGFRSNKEASLALDKARGKGNFIIIG